MNYWETCKDGIVDPELKSVMSNGIINASQLTSNELAIVSGISDILTKFNIPLNLSSLTSSRTMLEDDDDENPAGLNHMDEDGFPTRVSPGDRWLLAFKDTYRDKSRSRETKSAPTPSERRKSSKSPAEGMSKSTGSISTSHRSIPDLYQEKAHNLRVFSLDELKNATRDFNRLLKIGEGGFGSVYKGFIKPPDGKGDRIAVAIKMLNKDGLQGHKQWMAEVQFLAVVEHPNLVKLVGYCAVDSERGIQRLLVYEYMTNKTLEDHLFNRALPVLPWKRRLQIVSGAAQGLAYLHEGLEVQVIYRDFKASNVLLDEEFNPKLSDFGLAREGPTAGNTHVSTAVVGTYGYAAPDYVETGHLTTKSDVWSFGVVLYEILTGRRSFERNRPRSEQKLLDWVKQFPTDSNKFRMIMDPRLGGKYTLYAARMIAKLADSCLSKQKKDRPTMANVVEVLKQATQASETMVPLQMDAGSSSAAGSDTDKQPAAHVNEYECSSRRMAHVAKLKEKEHANAIGMMTVGIPGK